MLEIYADADACPVKQEVSKGAKRHPVKEAFDSNSWMRIPDKIQKAGSLGFIQAPLDAAAARNQQENKAVKDSQLALVDCGEEVGSRLKFPVELEISHGHRAAAENSRPARPKTQRYGQPAQEFYDPAEPELRPRRWLVLGKHAEDLLHTVEREHASRHYAQQGISVVRKLFKPFHERLPVSCAFRRCNGALMVLLF